MSLLSVKNLTLSFPSNNGSTRVLNDLSFSIRDGEILGLIGNSGCGKSMTAMSISGLLPSSANIEAGEIIYEDEDLLKLPPAQRRLYLGSKIGLVFQDPHDALDPLMNIENNLAEILKIRNISKDEQTQIIVDMLTTVGFDNPSEILKRYPHQLSGGQRQRVLIAGAALLKPKLLIADEPTSALDTVTTISILDLLSKLCHELHMTILFISHDLSVVKNFCDRVMVMNEGQIIETDTSSEILSNPRNAFTADLLTKAKLDPQHLGLKFLPVNFEADPIMTVEGLASGYKNGIFAKKSTSKTISDVSFDVYPNEIIGLIGSSGCGKTTLAKTIAGLIKPIEGSINYPDSSLGVVFQDPSSCLNPSHNVWWHLNEPLIATKSKLSKAERNKLIIKTIEEIGLQEKHLSRFPNELSGGQRQRVAIAMCLILNPSIIIADEPFSSLDASSQASILKILSDINVNRKTAIVLISHNLKIVRTMCSRVIVLDKGHIVEKDTTSKILSSPTSKAAKELLLAEQKLS